MAAYNWGGNLKAPLPFDGQVWADQDHHVWQWNAASQAWNRAPHIELQKAYSRAHSIMGFAAGADFLNPPFARKAGRIGLVWDEAYDLAFVEVRDMVDGTLYGRRAHMTLAQMLAWVGSIVPLAGGSYDRNIVLTVYEAVDTQREMPKWHVWNNLYASFRGRECYFGNNGYGRPGLPGRAAYSPNFASYHGVNLEYLLLSHFFSKVPPSSEPRSCWTTNARHGVYHHPNDASARIICTDAAKWTWNNATNTWVAAQGIGEEYLHDNTVGSNPALVWRLPGDNVLGIDSMEYGLRGLKPILGSGNGGQEALVVRCMRSSNDNNIKCFVVKPYGVTEAAWNLTADNEDLLAVPSYEGCASGGVGVINLTQLGLVEERGERGLRYNLARMYTELYTGYGSPWQLTHDRPVLPEIVRFYLRDRTTGVRRPTSKQHLYLERRRSCVPVAIMFRHS